MPNEKILEIDQKLQGDFQRLSNSSKQRIAERSGHYIHHAEPEIVIDEIVIMLNQQG
ncbi:hypothetical protein SAMN05421578_1205 [Paenibacillus macquariensis]|uniref:Alpha/beta hydrolase n=1 Tax=Paenibacillus macquariensis TaxID=948756 RepID=A0ABY1KBW5_9BACL|nr:hypothetical protein SAMN05421578_1205 [Paenibacillus macquariensis]